MGREDLDLAQGRDAHLDAGAFLHFAFDHLLDDGPLVGDACQVVLIAQIGQLEAHGPQRGDNGLGLGRVPRRRQPAQVYHGVAHARHALVVLGDDPAQRGLAGAHGADGGHEAGLVADLLHAQRVGQPFLGEEATRAALAAQGEVARVGGVHGDVQLQGQLALGVGRQKGDEVGAVGVGDQRADAADEPRPLQHLVDQRLVRSILGGDEVQPLAGVADGHVGQLVQVVVNDQRIDLAGGDVDHVQIGLAQQEGHEEEPLFVDLVHRAGNLDLARQRGQNDEGVALLHVTAGVGAADEPPEGHKLALEFVEVGGAVGG